MRVFKRAVTGWCAAAVAGCLLTGISVNAEEPVPMETGTPDSIMTVYDTKDVNHSGTVDLNDVVSVNKYLLGMYYGNHYPWLDANQNLIVDAADSQYILNSLVSINSAPYRFVSRVYNSQTGTVTESLVSPPAISTPNIRDGSATATDSRTYWKHSCSPNTSNNSYTTYALSPSTTSIPSQNAGDSTNTVIGTDDRYHTTLSENTGVVRICNDTGFGSGFIIGDHTIATAAHVVYDRTESNPHFSALHINLYNENGCLSGTTYEPVEVHIPSAYATSPYNERYIYDYALITVAEDLSDCVHFTLGETYNLFPSQFGSIPLFVTGCPGEVNGTSQGNPPNLYTASGNIGSVLDGYRIFHNVDTSPGDSGAPIYTITKDGLGNYTYSAIGIHTNGFTIKDGQLIELNSGPRITRYQLQFYLGNSNISYGSGVTQ